MKNVIFSNRKCLILYCARVLHPFQIKNLTSMSQLFVLGPVQAQLRSGNLRKPPSVQDLYVPVQNMYKHVKFWSVNPSTDDKVYVKPNKSQLKRQYTQQLNQIWDVSRNENMI